MANCPYCNENHPDELVMCPTTGHPIAKAAAPADPMLGAVLEGKYRVDGKLGEGGMGAVYVGEHVMMKRTVAIKTLLARFTANQNAVQRFQREAQAASAIGHPNIVTIHDLGQTGDGMLYIVMERLEGQDLAHEIKDLKDDPSGPKLMAPGRVLTLVTQAAEGLAAAHEKGVVHRDLKPDNIFVTPRKDGSELVKLLDFGISKIRTPGGEEARLTTDGSLLGTPYYMSPEQAQGKSDIDHRADIYAFGVILYELFTGRVPFEDANMLRVIAMHALEQPTAPRAINAQLPPEVEAVILKAMAKDAIMRFQSMVEVRDALAALQSTIYSGATAAGYIQAPGGSVAAASFPAGGTPPPVGQSGVGSGPVFTAQATPSGVGGSAVGGQPATGGLRPTSVIGAPQQGEPSSYQGYGASSVGGGPPSGVGQVTATPMTWDGQPAPKSGAGLKVALVVIILLLLGGVGAGIAFLAGSSGDTDVPVVAQPVPQPLPTPPAIPTPQYPSPQVPTPQNPAFQQGVATNPVVPAPAIPTQPPIETPPPAAQQVKISFVSTPTGARLFDGDRELGTTPHDVTLERGSDERSYALKHRGYRDLQISVVPDQDRTIERSLRRIPRSGRPSTGRPTKTGGGTPGPTGLFKGNPFDS